jgi:hypothetical protein
MSNTGGVGMAQLSNLNADGVDSGLLRHAWSTDVEMESVLAEPIFANKDLIAPLQASGKPQAIPTGKLIMDASSSQEGARDVTLTFIRSLNGTGRYGNAESLLSYEEQPRFKYVKSRSNDYSHGIAGQTFGIDYREMTPTQVFAKSKALLAQWRGEMLGYNAREAIIKCRNTTLTKSPLSLSQAHNPNAYVMSAATTAQPTYDSDPNIYGTSIGYALSNTTTGNMHMTISRILAMADWAQDSKYLQRVEIAGGKYFLLLAHPDEYTNLSDPSYSGSFASYWASGSKMSDLNKVIPGEIGLIRDDVLVVRDPRAATCAVSGNASAYTLTYGFMKMGRTSTRTALRTANVSFNVNLLLGANCLIKNEAEGMHYEEQKDEYGKFKNVGIFGAIGYEIPGYDVDTPTASTMQQESSAIVFTQR